MDLIATLSSQLGIDAEKSQGLAGAALGMLKAQVEQKLGGADASTLQSQLPELTQWQAKAAELGFGGGGGGGGGLGGGLLGAAASLFGGGPGLDLAAIGQLVSKAGLGSGAVQQLLPIVLEFLKSRLDPGLLSRVLGAIPALSGAKGGGLARALGGIL
jgi:hypothetical protein